MRKHDERIRSRGREHDPEKVVEAGMSPEAAEVDRAETLASTGNADSSFREIVSGSATGVGVDREEPDSEAIRDEEIVSRLARSSPDVDENDGDDSWLQDLPRDLT